jgi:hypothetical protein
MMKLIPVTVEEDGALRLPRGWPIPPNTRLAVVALPDDGLASGELSRVAEYSGSFAFLSEEPELYGDGDVLPGRANPGFSCCAPSDVRVR